MRDYVNTFVNADSDKKKDMMSKMTISEAENLSKAGYSLILEDGKVTNVTKENAVRTKHVRKADDIEKAI